MPRPTLMIANPIDEGGQVITQANVQRVTWELNAPGSIQWTQSVNDPKLNIPEAGKSNIQLWIDGRLKWRGILWDVINHPNFSEFFGEGHLSALYKRFIDTTTLELTNVDQLDIAWELFKYAQGGDPPATTRDLLIRKGSYSTSGHLRSRRYRREEHRNIMDALQEFPTLDDGFDFELKFDATRVTGAEKYLYYTPFYPRGASEFASLDFEWGGNVFDFEVREMGREIINENYATGGTSGTTKFENKYTDADAVNYYMRLFQGVTSHGSVLDVNWLLDHAKDEVIRRRVPFIIPTVKAAKFPTHHLSDDRMRPGNPVKLTIVRGRAAIRATYRIISLTWYPRQDQLDVELRPFWSPAGAFVEPRPT